MYSVFAMLKVSNSFAGKYQLFDGEELCVVKQVANNATDFVCD